MDLMKQEFLPGFPIGDHKKQHRKDQNGGVHFYLLQGQANKNLEEIRSL